MPDKNVIREGLLRADGLELGALSNANQESIQRLVQEHQRRVVRLRWVNIVAWFVLLMTFASLLVAQDSHLDVDYRWLALDRVGLIVMTGLGYIALVSLYLLRKAINNPPSEGDMRMTDLLGRVESIEALLAEIAEREDQAQGTDRDSG